MAKLSLWLATLAKDHPFTFLNHSLRAGDSLVGLTRRQIAAFHWLPAAQQSFLEDQIRRQIDRVSQFRQRILAATDDTPYSVLQARLDEADGALSWIRMAGDAAIAAFFGADKPKEREKARASLQGQLEIALKNPLKVDLVKPLEAAIDKLRKGSKGVTPFHWEIGFPEVFTVDGKGNVTGGFDVIVGNPPFAGKNTLINAHADRYLDWLQQIHEESHGNSDLVAHFFRRGFNLLRPGGCFGLIATNTIGQGDTRSTGLRWLCVHGGTIYRARKRLKWPGQAAVVVSVVHVCKGELPGPPLLDGHEVHVITAYLFHAGGHEAPARLKANDGRSFIGIYVLGMGFTFDDTDTKGVTTPLAEMEWLTTKDPRNKERIFPYIGGEEVNDSPTHAYHRHVISFEDFPLRRDDLLGASWTNADEDQREEWLRTGIVPLDYADPVAADWPDLLGIVERKVKPERLVQKDRYGKRYWWRFLRTRPEMRAAARGLPQVIVLSRIGNALAFTMLSASIVPNEKTVIFPFRTSAAFAILQSRSHELWARFFSSTLKDDLQYTPSDCFETFPFPIGFETLPPLEQTGREYYEFRAALMVKNNKGLTAIYNRFHDPEEENPDIVRLRELHAAMDRVVLDAYGWTDIQPKCEFLLDYEEEEDEEENGPRRRKKPWRYRCPDEIRDEVLARLLELNRQRALEEGQVLAAVESGGRATAKSKRTKKTARAGAVLIGSAPES